MSRNRKIKGAVGIALATCMTVSSVPSMSSAFNVLTNSSIITALAAEESKPLTTTLNQTEVGTHEGTGTYSYDAAAKKVTLTGAGTKFDKSAGLDDLYLASYAAKGNITISAKMSVSNPEAVAGYAGVIVRNTNDESGSVSAALYADMANGNKNQIRYGYHKEATGGGASQVNGDVTTDSTDIYIKLEVVGNKATYYVSSTADFSAETTVSKAQTIDGLDAKTVGFFATEGITATFSDVDVTSVYEEDGVTTNKVIFDSEVGELKPSYTTSASYSGKYDAANVFQTASDGNILTVIHTRSASTKGNIRQDEGVDYMLFPETSEDMTIKADVTVQSLDSGTDKQGIAMGQFSLTPGQAICGDTLHIMKNLKVQHTYGTAPGTGGCGAPNAAIETGATYTLTYTKTANTAVMKVVAADGTVLVDNSAEAMDLTQSSIYEGLQSGKTVNYGFAFTGVKVDLSNVQVLNSANQVIYDMNDYYIAVGVAPVIGTSTAKVSDDRLGIDLDWTIATEGSGNIKYSIYVSKDGGDYTKAGESKVNSFSYAAMDSDGKYQFKIVPAGGNTLGIESLTDVVTYKAPLVQTELTAEGASDKSTLSWTAVDGATSYDIYKKLGSDGTYALLANTTELSLVDSDVKKEEPYYYYIVAKNADNTSNASVTMQVLASDGHTGLYVYEDEATNVEVVSKSNDTIFEDKASITFKTDEDVTAQVFVNGTLKETKLATVNKNVTCDFNDLKQGRNDIVILLKDGQGNVTRKTYNFVSNPEYDIVVDAAYTGKDGAAVDGKETYKTVQAAVDSVAADNTEPEVIFIKNGEYDERIEVKSPYVSLLGEDAEKTHLFHAVAISAGNASSMWDRNAMYVDSTATGFTAENLTVENSFEYTNGSDQQADALCIVADQTACVNIRLVGYQDTLLTDSRTKDATGNYAVTRQYFEKCYITGNVDFIYGAGTSVFNDCDIVARYTQYKSDGCYTAGRTYATTEYGYVFDNCRFLAEEGVGDDTYRMARPWGADDSTTFINCYLGRAIATDEGLSYGDMSGNLAENARFAEYGSYGPGYAVNNTRPYLTSTQAKKYSGSTVMGDYDYESVVGGLYVKKSVEEPVEEPTGPTTEEPSTGEVIETPITGDRSRVGLFGGMAALSAILAAFAARKKKEESEE